MSVIQIENLTRRYGSRRGVESVSLAVPEGSIFGFLGPNGAGKTTTIRILLGFLRPSAGAARVFGLDSWTQSPRIKADVGYLPGDLRLYSWMNTLDALRIVGAIRRRDVLATGLEIADRLGLDTRVRIRAMSKGTRQKVGLVLDR